MDLHSIYACSFTSPIPKDFHYNSLKCYVREQSIEGLYVIGRVDVIVESRNWDKSEVGVADHRQFVVGLMGSS